VNEPADRTYRGNDLLMHRCRELKLEGMRDIAAHQVRISRAQRATADDVARSMSLGCAHRIA
jgi:hypothetical protein